ncbi:MAG TPA: PilN domain-containing protein [Candidatus Paceibacterota bacterium]|jgi:hypothetical protein|nr:PilN domain-containing protein [Candidatus Paceibacterota bacterium]
MDSSTQPTFLPHEAVTTVPARRAGGGLSELLLLVSIILFIVSAALAGGVFLYDQYLQNSNASKLSQLQSAQAAFDPALVQQLTRLDSRMSSAESLLSAHLAPSQFFSMLDQSTVQDVSFTSLSYNATNPRQVTLTMTGVAGSVNAIALQAEVFSQSGVITNPIFSNIDAEQDGVHFNFTALVNPSALSYQSYVASQSAQPSSQTQTQPASQPAAAGSLFESSSTPASH